MGQRDQTNAFCLVWHLHYFSLDLYNGYILMLMRSTTVINLSYLKAGGAEVPVKTVNKSLVHNVHNKRFNSQGNNISYPSTYTDTNRTTLQLELKNYKNIKHWTGQWIKLVCSIIKRSCWIWVGKLLPYRMVPCHAARANTVSGHYNFSNKSFL